MITSSTTSVSVIPMPTDQFKKFMNKLADNMYDNLYGQLYNNIKYEVLVSFSSSSTSISSTSTSTDNPLNVIDTTNSLTSTSTSSVIPMFENQFKEFMSKLGNNLYGQLYNNIKSEILDSLNKNN